MRGLGLSTVLVVGATLATAGPATAQVAGRNGIIVFDYSPPSSAGTQISSVDPATGTTKNLSKTAVGDDEPAVSPDGRRIAFRRNNAIWTMTTSGTSRRAVTTGAASAGDPTWSPDGTQIAYADNGDLMVVPAAGGASRLVLHGGDNNQPAWSPNGTVLASTSYRVADIAQVFTVRLDGTHLVDVSHDTDASENNPDWTPDSGHLVFNNNNRSPDGERENSEATPTGAGIVQVSSAIPSESYDPAVSPDGRRLTFTVNDNGANQISLGSRDGPAGAVGSSHRCREHRWRTSRGSRWRGLP